MKTSNARILAIDPGTRLMGVAFLDEGKLVYHGVKVIARGRSPQETLQRAKGVILRLIDDLDPQVIAVEKTFFSRNRNTALLNVLFDEIRFIAKRRRLRFISFAPSTIKKYTTGNGWADKKQVATAVVVKFPELKVFLTQDRAWKERFHNNMFDAVALPDGRVIYTRWEYVDRSRVSFHHLWTSNPDGTGQMVYYGNQHPGTVMIDAKPIPGTDQVVAIFSPKHGKPEHTGMVTIVSPKAGPDDPASAEPISKSDDYRDPYPLSAERFLVAQGPRLLLMDRRGNTEEIFHLPAELSKKGAECYEPRPLAPRKREPVIPPRISVTEAMGRLIVSDVYAGRRMDGVQRGEIKKLLVLETLPKPINDSGKMPPISFGGTFTLERVLGTVPVESDGSAQMEVPALRSLFFVALDANNNTVQRMMSFLSVMPGETTSCIGCHEQRTRAPGNAPGRTLQALHRSPSRIEPIAGIPDVLDYPRDVQPILDRHCLRCHDYSRRDGGVILSGDHGPIYSHSYYTLTALGYVSDGRDRLESNLAPRAIGTSASSLMKLLDGQHYQAVLTAHEKDLIRYWIESAAAYPGTYAALGTGMIGGYPKSKLDTSDRAWPESKAAAEAIRRRCLGCHDQSLPMPQYLSDDLGLELSNPDFADVRIRYSRHLLFNLTRPKKSLILLAPLSKQAGGYARCGPRTADHRSEAPAAVFADEGDADYQKILALCQAGKRGLDAIGRFDMLGFRPTAMYVREMQRYGILPNGLRVGAATDVYAADRAYWRSLWWQPRND